MSGAPPDPAPTAAGELAAAALHGAADTVPPTEPAAELAAAALRRAAEVVRALTCDQIAALAAGRAELVCRPAPAARPGRGTGAPAGTSADQPCRAFDVAAAVTEISALSSRDEVAGWLAARDRELTVPVLREVARRLGPTVSAAASSKAGLKRNIVEGTAGFRERSAAMSGGGAWQR